MVSQVQAIIDGAYWEGNNLYAEVDGEPYQVDTGAEVSMTRRNLKTI